jgi:hypothetical protein
VADDVADSVGEEVREGPPRLVRVEARPQWDAAMETDRETLLLAPERLQDARFALERVVGGDPDVMSVEEGVGELMLHARVDASEGVH